MMGIFSKAVLTVQGHAADINWRRGRRGHAQYHLQDDGNSPQATQEVEEEVSRACWRNDENTLRNIPFIFMKRTRFVYPYIFIMHLKI